MQCCSLQTTVVPNVKNPPRIRLKNSSNWQIIFAPSTIWQVLNVKYSEWPETEAIWICWNLQEKNCESLQVNLFLAGLGSFKLVCRLTALRSACMHSVTDSITYLTTNPVWLSLFLYFFAQISRQIAKITVDSHQELFDLTIFSFFVQGKLNFDTC